MPNRSTTALTLIILLAGLSFFALWMATRWGIGTSPDSIAYIGAARNLWTGTAGADQSALIFRPPFYPVLLATMRLAGIDPLLTARWLNALLYALNTLMVGLIIWHYQPRSPWLAVCGSLLMLAAMPMLEIHAYAWTEPLFILLGYGGLAILSLYLDSKKNRWLVVAAILFALATLTRYAGVAFIITGGCALLFLTHDPWGKRIGRAVIFGWVAALPIVLWVARHRQAEQVAGGRSWVFHPIGRDHFWQALFTLSDWLQLPAATPGVARAGLLTVVGGTAVLFLIFRLISPFRPHNPAAGIPAFYKLLLLFLPIYILFLMVSVSFLDAATPFDNRILSPAYVACLFLTMFLLDELFHQARRWRMAQITMMVVLVAFLTLSFIRNGRWLLEASRHGLGFSSVAWQQADIIAQIKRLPPDTVIFSNVPGAIYFLTSRPANPLPRKFEATTQQINATYDNDLAEIAERIEQEDGVVVYFNALTGNPALPATQELTDTLSLRLLTETAEGAIYGGQ